MKKTDGLTRAIGVLLFVAMLCYIGFAVARSVTQGAQTALASEATLTLSADMTGLIIRSESPVCSEKKYIDVTAVDGQRLAAGETIATVYASAQALDRAVQLRALSEEIEQLQSQQSEPVQAAPGAAYMAVDRLAAAVQSGDMTAAVLECEAVEELLLPTGETELDGDYLRALKNRYNSLVATEAYDSETIAAQSAGLFCRVTDGLESLTPDDALALTPETLRAHMDGTSSPVRNAIGKMVDGFTWYYAALMQEQDAARLSVGDEPRLRFERYCSGALHSQVVSIGAAEDGQCVVVFALREGMAELASARRVAASLEFESYSGIRVPQKALHRYWAGYMDAAEAAMLSPGETVTLMKGSWSAQTSVSEIIEAEDGQCQIVVCWPWAEDNVPPASARGAALSTDGGAGYYATDYYDAETQPDCLCVFTMTGRQAERRKVSVVYAGDDYVLVASQGADALRVGNEIIVQADGLYDGRVFD